MRSASGRRDSGEFVPARGRQNSAERGSGGVLRSGIVSALGHSPLAGIGEEEKLADIDDERLSPSPSTELEACSHRSKETLPAIIANKASGHTKCLASTAGERSSSRGGADGLRGELGGSSSAMVGDQQQEMTDPVTEFTPRRIDLPESSWVNSVLRKIGGGGDVPSTGRVVPVEPV